MRALAVLALSLVLLAPEAHAQLGGLLNRAKRAAQETVQERDPARTPPPASAQAAHGNATAAVEIASGARGPLAPTGPMPLSPAGYAPGVDALAWMKSLAGLSPSPVEGTILAPYMGRLLPTHVLFPAPEATYQFVLTDASGEVVTWQDLELRPDPNLPAYATLAAKNEAGNRERASIQTPAGSYRASLTANGHDVGSVPFEIVVEASDDPFDSRSAIWTEGAWTAMGVLTIGAETGDLGFIHWTDARQGSQDKARIEVAVFSGSTRLTEARGSEQILYRERRYWSQNDVAFYKERGPLTLSDLSDGDYRIEAFEPGQAPFQTFRFRVESGQIAPADRSALDYAPRPDFLAPRSQTVADREGQSTLIWLQAE